MLTRITKFICALTLSAAIAGYANLSSEVLADQTDAAPKYALLVGISKYKNGNPGDIDACVNDVELLRSALVEWGFPDDPKHILTLRNEQATYRGITDAFRTHLTGNAARARAEGKEATTLYYFCGHGSQFPNESGDDEENDGMDETFVAWDSRTSGAFDILDDEMADLRFDLAKETSDSVFIFDSCHSGTGSRNAQADGTDRLRTEPDNRKRGKFVRKNPASKSPADPTKYVEISAAHSSLEALSETTEFAAPEKPYSLMTKALVQALNAAKVSGSVPTYRDLMRDVQHLVANGRIRSEQSPQLEGNRDAAIFGLQSGQRRALIEVTETKNKNKVTIRAGAIHGLRPGSQISFYRKGSAGRGLEGWIGNGSVGNVSSFESEVTVDVSSLSQGVKIDRNAGAVLSSAAIAEPIYLDLATDAKPATSNIEVIEKVRSTIESDNTISSGMLKMAAPARGTANPSAGVLKIGKAKISEILSDQSRPGKLRTSLISPLPEIKCSGEILERLPLSRRVPDAAEAVYYVYEGKPGSPPLFGKTFRIDDVDVAAKLVDVIRARVFQQNISAIDFKNSDLNKNVSVSIASVPATAMTPKCVDGQVKYSRLPAGTGFSDITSRGETTPGAFVRVSVKNISGEINRRETGDQYASGLPLHFAVIAMMNDSQIRSLYGSTGADEPVDDGKEVSRFMNIDLPATAIRFAVFVSRKAVDFSFLQIGSRERDKGPILGALFANAGRRDSNTPQVFSSPGDWGVVHYELRIKE